MNITTHIWSLRLVIILFSFAPLFAFSQPSEKINSNTIYKIGKLLDMNKISATEFDSDSKIWTWRFLFAEEELKNQINTEKADQLTSFEFTYNQNTHSRQGQITKAKINIDQNEAFDIVLSQLEKNLRSYKKLDIIKLNGKLFYLIYFPSESVQI